MSYITEKDIGAIERLYGKPPFFEAEIDMTPLEFERLRASQVHGRAHDITLFIFKGDKLLFNAKHFYPEGLYRAPSGAAKPGEGLVEGALREAFEETGTVIELERFLARIKVRFFNKQKPQEHVDWTSYVFKARYISGEISPRDKREIREARLVDFDEIPKFNKIMIKSGIAGFRYRVFLTEIAMKLLEKDILGAIKTKSQKD
jgi:ADP-ribose pyrophosphatase YjhB (NUDIX family)